MGATCCSLLVIARSDLCRSICPPCREPWPRGECSWGQGRVVVAECAALELSSDLCCTTQQAEAGLLLCRHVCDRECLVLEAAPPPSKAERQTPAFGSSGASAGATQFGGGAREEGRRGGWTLTRSPYFLRCFRSGPARHLHGRNFGTPFLCSPRHGAPQPRPESRSSFHTRSPHAPSPYACTQMLYNSHIGGARSSPE